MIALTLTKPRRSHPARHASTFSILPVAKPWGGGPSAKRMVEGQRRRVMAPPSAAAPKAQFILSDCKAVEGPLPPPHRFATGRLINRTPPIQPPHSPPPPVAAHPPPHTAPSPSRPPPLPPA